MESMYGDPHAAHRSALAAAGSHSHHSVSVSPASAAAAAAAAHLNSHGAAAAAAAAAAMHHSAAAAAAAAAQHSQSPYHSLGNHVSAQQVGANHMAAAAAAAAASSSVPDVHKRDKDAIYGYVIVVWPLFFFFITCTLYTLQLYHLNCKKRFNTIVQYSTVHTVPSVACSESMYIVLCCGQQQQLFQPLHTAALWNRWSVRDLY